MAPKVLMGMHNMSILIEDEPLTWYLFNAFIHPETREVLNYKDIMKPKEKNGRPLLETIVKIIWNTCRGISSKSKKETKHFRFVACNNC